MTVLFRRGYFCLRWCVPILCPKYIRISIDFKNQSDIKNFLAGINIFSKNHCSNYYSIMASRDRRKPSHQAFSMGKPCLKIHRDARTGRIANFPSGRPVGNVPVDLWRQGEISFSGIPCGSGCQQADCVISIDYYLELLNRMQKNSEALPWRKYTENDRILI